MENKRFNLICVEHIMDVPYMEVVGFESKWVYKSVLWCKLMLSKSSFHQFVGSNSEGKISHAPLCLIQKKEIDISNND